MPWRAPFSAVWEICVLELQPLPRVFFCCGASEQSRLHDLAGLGLFLIVIWACFVTYPLCIVTTVVAFERLWNFISVNAFHMQQIAIPDFTRILKAFSLAGTVV